MVTLYMRPGCHWCGETYRVLSELRHIFHFEIDEVSIEEEPERELRFGSDVPVLAVNDSILLRQAYREAEIHMALMKHFRLGT